MPTTEWMDQTVEARRVYEADVFDEDVYVGYANWADADSPTTDWEEQ